VATAQAIVDRQFVEVIIAPSIADGVLEVTLPKLKIEKTEVKKIQVK